MKSLVVLILVVMGSMATACYASETGSAVSASVQMVSTAVTASAPVVLTDTELTKTVGTSAYTDAIRAAKNRSDIAKKTAKRNALALSNMSAHL